MRHCSDLIFLLTIYFVPQFVQLILFFVLNNVQLSARMFECKGKQQHLGALWELASSKLGHKTRLLLLLLCGVRKNDAYISESFSSIFVCRCLVRNARTKSERTPPDVCSPRASAPSNNGAVRTATLAKSVLPSLFTSLMFFHTNHCCASYPVVLVQRPTAALLLN